MTTRQKSKLLAPDPRSEWDAEPLLLRTYHYAVPPTLQPKIAVGQLLWVPFGPKQAQGILVGLDPVAPVPNLREITSLVYEEPVVTPAQLELARWMSRHYLCPLFDSLALMLPRGVLREAVVTLIPGEPPPAGRLDPEQEAALAAVREAGKMPLAEAKKRFGQGLIQKLLREGWLVRRDEMPAPRVRPQTARFVRLVADLEQARRAVAGWRTEAKASAMLEALAERGGMIPVEEMRRLSSFSAAALRRLAEEGLVAIEERGIWRDPLAGKEFVLTAPPRFTVAQEAVWREVLQALNSAKSQVLLIHGVTGSGKTEIYLRAVLEVLKRGKQAIVLVPEIALTPQTIRRFAARFPGRLAVIHSQLSAGQRYDQWRRIRDGLADVVIGPRSALFSPLPRLGLIILDEEHESSYKQEEIPGQQVPAYHAREAAVELGRITGAPVILGSATPSVLSFYRAQRGEYMLLQMAQRVMGHRQQWEAQRARYLAGGRRQGREIRSESEDAQYMELPPVQVVDLREELRAGNRSIFSRALQQALREVLEAREQAILFLNRRGASTFVLCRECGLALKCPQCQVALTYHSAGEQLLCHRCGYRQPSPETCPACGSRKIRFFGVGTQKVEETARQLFPQARLLRWDSDAAAERGSSEALWERFANHEADILIGTQMIAKGLDLPLVTLVGVISADTALYLPDFRAGERTFQLLEQVAGRAGRSILGGRVIVQTYSPEHYAIQAASRHDYEGFYRQEIALRRIQGYPPITDLARLVYADAQETRAQREAERMWRELTKKAQGAGLTDIHITGPTPCYFAIMNGKWRWQILLRGPNLQVLLQMVAIPPGWYVDVDPESIL